MANQDGFKDPTKEMGHRKDVHVVPELLHRDVGTVDPVLFVHVDVEGCQTRIYPDEDTPHCLVVLEQQEQQTHQVEHAAAKYHSPYCWMRSRKRTIGKRKDGYDHKQKEDGYHAIINIPSHIGGIAERKKTME